MQGNVLDQIRDDSNKELVDLLRSCNIKESYIGVMLMGLGSHTEYYQIIIDKVNENKELVNDEWIKTLVLDIFKEIEANEDDDEFDDLVDPNDPLYQE